MHKNCYTISFWTVKSEDLISRQLHGGTLLLKTEHVTSNYVHFLKV